MQTLTFQTTCLFLAASNVLTYHLRVSSSNKSMLLHLSSAGTALTCRLYMTLPDITSSQILSFNNITYNSSIRALLSTTTTLLIEWTMILLTHSMRVLVFMFLTAEKTFTNSGGTETWVYLKQRPSNPINYGNLLVNRGMALSLINANHPVYSIEIKSD